MALEPSAIAQRGRKIYDRVRHRFESDNRGAFAIIDLNSEKILLADSPESAYREARKEREFLTAPGHRGDW